MVTTQSGVATFASGLSSGAIALFGVSYLGLLWALIGAIVSLMFTPPQSRKAALFAVIGGMFTGAALGDLAIVLLQSWIHVADVVADKLHIGVAFVVGAGAKQFLGKIIELALLKLGKDGGGA